MTTESMTVQDRLLAQLDLAEERLDRFARQLEQASERSQERFSERLDRVTARILLHQSHIGFSGRELRFDLSCRAPLFERCRDLQENVLFEAERVNACAFRFMRFGHRMEQVFRRLVRRARSEQSQPRFDMARHESDAFLYG